MKSSGDQGGSQKVYETQSDLNKTRVGDHEKSASNIIKDSGRMTLVYWIHEYVIYSQD